MSRELRVCNPFNFPLLIEYDGGEITGEFAPLINDLVRDMERYTNVTFVIRSKNDGLGELINSTTGAYDGCIGHLQKNQSDFITQMFDYPFPADHISQGYIMNDVTVQFVSMYRPRTREEVQEVQIESHFNSFDTTVWLLCFLVLLVAYSALHLRYLAVKWMRSLYISYVGGMRTTPNVVSRWRGRLSQVLSHMTRHGQLRNARCLFKRIIFITLSFFSLMVLFYFNVFIKTELVSVKPPAVFASYMDLLENKVPLVFMRGMQLHPAFKDAPVGTVERLLWQMTLSKLPLEDVLVDIDSQNFRNELPHLFLGKIVGVTDSVFGPVVLRETCAFVVSKERLTALRQIISLPHLEPLTLFPVLSQDPNARTKLKGFVLNENLESNILRRVKKYMKDTHEHGLIIKLFKNIGEMKIADRFMNLPRIVGKSGIVNECSSNIIYQPRIALASVGVRNMRNFIHCLLGLLAIAAVILALEIIVSRLKERMNRA